MSNNRQSHWSRRMVAFVAAVGLLGTISVVGTATPASAGPCDGDTGQSSVWAECEGSGGSGGGGRIPGYNNPLPGTTWVKVQTFPDRVCTDREGNTSYFAWIYGLRNGARVTDNLYRCITQHTINGGGAVGPTVADVELLIPKPVIESDYTGSFLTGAEVQFNFAEPGTLTRAIPNFSAYVQARPTKYTWNFGDGIGTSSDASPTYTYPSKSFAAKTAAGRTVKVTVTVEYDAILQVQAADGPLEEQTLGTVTQTSEIERPIVEVFSALTQQAR